MIWLENLGQVFYVIDVDMCQWARYILLKIILLLVQLNWLKMKYFGAISCLEKHPCRGKTSLRTKKVTTVKSETLIIFEQCSISFSGSWKHFISHVLFGWNVYHAQSLCVQRLNMTIVNKLPTCWTYVYLSKNGFHSLTFVIFLKEVFVLSLFWIQDLRTWVQSRVMLLKRKFSLIENLHQSTFSFYLDYLNVWFIWKNIYLIIFELCSSI